MKGSYRGLGYPQQAKRRRRRRWSGIGISEKDILIHCLPKTDIYHYCATVLSNHLFSTILYIREIIPLFHRKFIFGYKSGPNTPSQRLIL